MNNFRRRFFGKKAGHLTFTALEAGTFTLTIPASVKSSHLSSISYSLDNGKTWTTTNNDDTVITITTPTVAEGGTVLWKGSGTQMAVNSTSGNYSRFSSTGNYQISGNVMSLLYQNTFDIQKEIEATYALCCLFRNNDTLIRANDLEFPAMKLTDSCYREMFGDCYYLVEARFDLPAAIAPANAYRSIFGNDERLVTADVTIYAHTLYDNCCRWMCGGCKELTTAPVILATTLSGSGVLQQVFNGCKKLQYIKAMFTTAPSSTTTNQFTNGVASTGTFVKNGAATWTTTGVNAVPTGWTVVTEEPDYLTFRFVENGTFYWYTSNESSFTRIIEYKKNDGAWTSVTSSADGTVCTVENGDVIQLRGASQAYATSAHACYFGTSGRAYISGNLNSLRNYNTKLDGYSYRYLFRNCANIDIDPTNDLVLIAATFWEACYYGLFYGCTSLTKTPEFPEVTLVKGCYQSMFQGCTSLTTMPYLPSKTLANQCYSWMFSGCTNLTQTTELIATTTADLCYQGMFSGCTSLVVAPKIKARTFKASSCQDMFNGCTSLTTIPEFVPETIVGNNVLRAMFAYCTSLTAAPELPATEITQECYRDMFAHCSSLTTAPELPATVSAVNCYYFMFTECTSLTVAPELPSTTLARGCYSYMFNGCTSLTTAPELPSTALAQDCYNGMFSYCTSLTTAPVLPALTLTSNCYYRMFNVCRNLNYVKCLATDISAQGCTVEWLMSVSETGTFVKNSEMSSWPSGHTGIPTNWTVENVARDYLKFTALESGTFTLTIPASITSNELSSISYSTDNGSSWIATQNSDSVVTITTPTISAGSSVLWKGSGTAMGNTNEGCQFASTCRFECYGNIMSLLYENDFEEQITIPSSYCFYSLFRACTNLEKAPELPATTLTYACYKSMFYGCSNLTTAPVLPATTAEFESYGYMFYGCSNLNYIKMMATVLRANTLSNWVTGVSASGTFVKNVNATWSGEGNSGIPRGWTVQTANS